MSHKIGYAKQHLSAVIRLAAREPQLICNRASPVAAVVSAAEYGEFLQWKAARARPTMAALLGDLRRICAAENYAFEAPPRTDRKNPLVEERHAARRHKRRQ